MRPTSAPHLEPPPLLLLPFAFRSVYPAVLPSRRLKYIRARLLAFFSCTQQSPNKPGFAVDAS